MYNRLYGCVRTVELRPFVQNKSKEGELSMNYKALAVCLGAVMLAGSVTGCASEEKVMNYTAPKEGEKVVVMTIAGYGDVTFKLFSDLMPKAAENFLTLAEEGYYDGIIFHRVIADFMIQGGDPTGTGRGGESCWGGKFDGGTSKQLIHVPGALCYANSAGPTTDGSQFYVVTGQDSYTLADLSYYEEEYDVINAARLGYDITFSDEAKALYQEQGGTPHLDGGYTVFGQVIDGLDIIYQISYTETDTNPKSPTYSRPLEDVVIEKMTVKEYDGSDIRWYKSDYDTLAAK